MKSIGLEKQYLKEQLDKGIRDVFEAQRLIATQRIYQWGSSRAMYRGAGQTLRGRSGILRYALENPEYKFIESGDGWEAQATVPLYIRFLDMKEFGNYKIYNRQVWGILYTETLRNIRYEYRDWVKRHIGETLSQPRGIDYP